MTEQEKEFAKRSIHIQGVVGAFEDTLSKISTSILIGGDCIIVLLCESKAVAAAAAELSGSPLSLTVADFLRFINHDMRTSL
jgi:hypothetical protein